MLVGGLIYITAVYVTYFFIGMGIFTLAYTAGLSRPFYWFAAIVAIIAGLFEIKDFFWYGRGFSLAIPKRFTGTIKKKAASVTGAGAVLLGISPTLVVLSIPYVFWLDRRMENPRDGCWHFGAFLLAREPWDRDKVVGHWRAWIIKGFFGAFMISILPGGFAEVVLADPATLANEPGALALALISLLFTVDV